MTNRTPGPLLSRVPASTARFLEGEIEDWERRLSFFAARAVDVPYLEPKLAVATFLFEIATTIAALRTRSAELGRALPDRRVPDPSSGGTVAEQLRAAAIENREAQRRLKVQCDALDQVSDEPTVRVLEQAQRVLATHATQLEELLKSADWPAPCSYPPTCDPRFGPASDARRSPAWRVEVLHRNLSDLEVPTIELCCSAILDFPEMPLAFVLDMSRQAWDEARHARMFWMRLEALGGQLGAVDHQTSYWDMVAGRPLALRLAIHQRWGEWAGVCGARWHAELLRAEGDDETARLFEFVVADEVLHVAIGNQWIDRLIPDPVQRQALDREAARIRTEAGRSAPPAAVFPFDPELCARCGFDAEVASWLDDHHRVHGSRMRPAPT